MYEGKRHYFVPPPLIKTLDPRLINQQKDKATAMGWSLTSALRLALFVPAAAGPRGPRALRMWPPRAARQESRTAGRHQFICGFLTL